MSGCVRRSSVRPYRESSGWFWIPSCGGWTGAAASRAACHLPQFEEHPRHGLAAGRGSLRCSYYLVFLHETACRCKETHRPAISKRVLRTCPQNASSERVLRTRTQNRFSEREPNPIGRAWRPEQRLGGRTNAWHYAIGRREKTHSPWRARCRRVTPVRWQTRSTRRGRAGRAF